MLIGEGQLLTVGASRVLDEPSEEDGRALHPAPAVPTPFDVRSGRPGRWSKAPVNALRRYNCGGPDPASLSIALRLVLSKVEGQQKPASFDDAQDALSEVEGHPFDDSSGWP